MEFDITITALMKVEDNHQTKLWLAVQNLTQNEIGWLYSTKKTLLNGWLTISWH